MKKFLLRTATLRRLMLAAALTCSAAASAFTVYVRGAEKKFDSSSIDRIVLTQDKGATLYLTNGSTETLSPAEFSGIGFSEADGVDSPTIETSGLRLAGGMLTSTDGSAITLIDLNGVTVAESKKGIVNVSQLRPGVYVAKTESKTAKIVIR